MPATDSGNELIAIVGLGNPGDEYAQTRHNTGFWLVDRLADRARATLRREAKFSGDTAKIKIGDTQVLLLKPQTFMNRSGLAIQALAQFYKLKPDQILVAHDELDLPAGTIRLKLGGGHGGHNGLRDTHRVLGDGYRRLRIGIGHPGDKNLVLNYVLGRPSRADEQLILDGLDASIGAIDTWLGKGWERGINQLHSPADGKKNT
ncbi:MAG TPA: aminoacyl-tRNA hydrolase [Fontimonas sp.]